MDRESFEAEFEGDNEDDSF